MPAATRRRILRYAIVLGVIVAAAVALATRVHAWLALNAPIDTATILVVEGWIPDYALAAAVEEHASGRYRTLATTGVPLALGSHLSTYKSYAKVAAASLVAMGIDQATLMAVPAPRLSRNRTYAMALALAQRLRADEAAPAAINVFTLGAHGRRSQLMYTLAFEATGLTTEIGVIAHPDRDYDANAWWRYSEGVKRVIVEAIGYLHALLFFDPDLEMVAVP